MGFSPILFLDGPDAGAANLPTDFHQTTPAKPKRPRPAWRRPRCRRKCHKNRDPNTTLGLTMLGPAQKMAHPEGLVEIVRHHSTVLTMLRRARTGTPPKPANQPIFRQCPLSRAHPGHIHDRNPGPDAPFRPCFSGHLPFILRLPVRRLWKQMAVQTGSSPPRFQRLHAIACLSDHPLEFPPSAATAADLGLPPGYHGGNRRVGAARLRRRSAK